MFVLTTATVIYNLKMDDDIIKASKGYFKVVAYMDDIKCHTNNKTTAELVTKKLVKYAKEIGLEINEQKCAIHSNNKDESTQSMLPEVNKAYKYLGLKQTDKDTEENVNDLNKKIIEKAETIMQSHLTTWQKKEIFNSTIIPAATYITGNLSPEEGVRKTLVKCRKMDDDIRKIAVQQQVKTLTTCNQRYTYHQAWEV